jgi:oxygen-independent coproporphyrinogen-3 oxidase
MLGILMILINKLLFTQSTVLTKTVSAPNGAYIHIPFCRRRCYYCDFPIKVIGDRKSTAQSESETYTSILCKEIELTAKKASLYQPLDTVYFGGGTPSLLPDHC